jgi:hypothetical protein
VKNWTLLANKHLLYGDFYPAVIIMGKLALIQATIVVITMHVRDAQRLRAGVARPWPQVEEEEDMQRRGRARKAARTVCGRGYDEV